MACVASPLAPDSPSCLHDDVAALYGEAQKLYADAQQDFNGDDAPAAWDLPEAMLTGGMPQGFENTRRDVGSLTMKIANKKADIEALLERMAKLQSRYKNMTEGKEEMSRTVKKAARKSQREKRRRKKKRDKAKKAKKKMAHPLDGIDEFSTTVKQEEPVPQEEEPVPSKPGAHPLDDHFALGTAAEEAADFAAEAKKRYIRASEPREVRAVPAILRMMLPDVHLLVLAYSSLCLAAFGESLVPLLYGQVIDAIAIYPDMERFRTYLLYLIGTALFTGVFTGVRASKPS